MVNGLSGERMLIGLAIGIAVLIFLVLKTKVQAFLALIICTVIVGVVGGMPLVRQDIRYCQFNYIRFWRDAGKHWHHHRLWRYDGTNF